MRWGAEFQLDEKHLFETESQAEQEEELGIQEVQGLVGF